MIKGLYFGFKVSWIVYHLFSCNFKPVLFAVYENTPRSSFRHICKLVWISSQRTNTSRCVCWSYDACLSTYANQKNWVRDCKTGLPLLIFRFYTLSFQIQKAEPPRLRNLASLFPQWKRLSIEIYLQERARYEILMTGHMYILFGLSPTCFPGSFVVKSRLVACYKSVCIFISPILRELLFLN